MKPKKLQTSWIIYPNRREHKAPDGFEGIIPPIGTKICIYNEVYFVYQHVMYYDKDKNPIYSIRARGAYKFEETFQAFDYKINRNI